MNTTSATLLDRLRLPNDQQAWCRFVDLYTPLLHYWARRAGLQPNDAADLIQDVFAHLVRKIPDFVYDPNLSFRSWLRTVATHLLRDRKRRKQTIAVGVSNAAIDDLAVDDPTDSLWESEYRRQIVGQALRLMQTDFQPTTWKACWRVIEGHDGACVARELGISVGAVYVAKSRVLRRLRQELHGLLD